MTLSVTTILLILFAHFIGDFILQTNWMAQNKAKNSFVLTHHVVVYSLCLLPFGPLFALVNFILHFATDYVSSRITAKLWVKGDLHWFFATIGADQLLHYAALFLTYPIFSGWSFHLTIPIL